jgi:hypothetical protein
MAYLRDRATLAARTIRRICRDIPDKQAEEIETFIRCEFAEERAEGFAEGRAAEQQSD